MLPIDGTEAGLLAEEAVRHPSATMPVVVDHSGAVPEKARLDPYLRARWPSAYPMPQASAGLGSIAAQHSTIDGGQ